MDIREVSAESALALIVGHSKLMYLFPDHTAQDTILVYLARQPIYLVREGDANLALFWLTDKNGWTAQIHGSPLDCPPRKIRSVINHVLESIRRTQRFQYILALPPAHYTDVIGLLKAFGFEWQCKIPTYHHDTLKCYDAIQFIKEL